MVPVLLKINLRISQREKELFDSGLLTRCDKVQVVETDATPNINEPTINVSTIKDLISLTLFAACVEI